MKNEILMRRQCKMLVVPDELPPCPQTHLATVIKNMEAYGYTVSNDMFYRLKLLSAEKLKEFYLEFTEIASALSGEDKISEPMYPNFPSEVMNADESELYLNALIHYLTVGRLKPNITKNKRLPLFDETNVKVVSLAKEEDIYNIMQNIMEAKTSISETDKSDLAWFFIVYSAERYIPNRIPHKENAAYICSLYLKYSASISRKVIYKHIRTATDVLRLITAMSDGDVSLASNIRFKSISRKNRRMMLHILEHAPNLEEDMNRYAEKWVRVGEILHPGNYHEFPKALEAFRKLRTNENISMFNGRINKYLEDGDIETAVFALKARPGEFARKLDHLLRTANASDLVIKEFGKIAKRISTPVLLQIKNHFENRNNQSPYRVFFPKGSIAKSKLIPNDLPPIPEAVCKSIVCICNEALKTIYAEREFLGGVYMDEEFKHYCVPFSQRSASKSARTVVRGSKLPLDDSKSTIRAFVHWKNIKSSDNYNDERVDIDLSAIMYDENWNCMEHVSYTNLKSSKYKSCHSGDIVDAPDGASEFIDIDMDSVRNFGGRYIVFTTFCFTSQPYKDIPECFVGWMEREVPESGEIFEPSTVKNKIDITTNATIYIPMVVDVVDKKVIWMDMTTKSHPQYHVNLENNQGGIIASCMAITQMNKPTLYELIDLNIKARGVRADNPADANIVFCTEIPKEQDPNKKYITPFMTEVFMSEYL